MKSPSASRKRCLEDLKIYFYYAFETIDSPICYKSGLRKRLFPTGSAAKKKLQLPLLLLWP